MLPHLFVNHQYKQPYTRFSESLLKTPVSRSLFRSTFNVSSMTLLSRVFGLIRDVVIASLFGARDHTDAFFIAFKIPNYFRRLFAEGGFSQAFVPVLTEIKTRQSEDDVRELLDYVAGTLAGVLFLITVVGIIAAPVLMLIFASGFTATEGKFELAVDMLRITFPYLLFISLTAMAGGILNTWQRFTVPAFTPVLLNLSLIACAVWLAPHLERPVMALAIGVFIAGVLQLLFQLPFLLRLRLIPRPRFKWRHAGVTRIARLMVPTLFAGSVAQINIMIDMMIASWLAAGSISWLYYSDRLMEFPLGVFGIAIATVILPNLSEKHANGSADHFSHTLDWALRWVLVIGLPATLALIVLSTPLIATIFQYGAFVASDVDMAGRSLIAYAVGLLGLILVKVLSAGFFSRQDTRTPVRIAFIAMGCNVVLNIILVFPLAHAGLALATSLAALVNSSLLYYMLRKSGTLRHRTGWVLLFVRVFAACLAMCLVLWWLQPPVESWLLMVALDKVLQLALLVVAGAFAYGLTLWLGGLRPAHMNLPTD
jgi:putative peptidoglycan lipid II flippase